ncbi:uncharacterized protein Z519_03636 [Cladophialophora bantiana CBS 173.52]|uniref:Uncharacterized protein n=1 Tax=Cladophialophora bantiana (strain ATCC 10958 / CBS 173.52 / CDC B-1940 / NIH 8579) TaxID=1442370 RepID=A0A0D2HVU0_CLAB1|nr:uncharacterized protein Z519_03636 [Cladophialophora bantiana CBS 173.52]KIW95055.1 hypothetical protein Z519_03636 [Cladophialophora bantiana CBS 173.52]
MASYNRVLEIFGRDHAPSMQCNQYVARLQRYRKTAESSGSDIHPWEILINGERWPGKVRLIGFVDAFFLMAYSSKERFEHGIIVYIPEKYFSFKKDAIHYTVTSLGHEVGLKTEYPKSSLQRYEVKIRKNSDVLKNRHIKRGVNQHGLADMMYDAIKLGFITHAQLVVLSTKLLASTGAGDIMNSYWNIINAPGDAAVLSNERT